jgi:predicted nucleotidyltransferase
MLSVARRFNRLIANVQPGLTAVRRARLQFSQIQTRLNRSFRVARIVPIGSHAKNTALASYSDVDILAVLRRHEARWGGTYVSSDTFLRNVRDDLVDRYPATGIRRDGQAAVVHFAQGAYRVDVVPAIYFQAASSGHPIYRIPDGAGDAAWPLVTRASRILARSPWSASPDIRFLFVGPQVRSPLPSASASRPPPCGSLGFL